MWNHVPAHGVHHDCIDLIVIEDIFDGASFDIILICEVFQAWVCISSRDYFDSIDCSKRTNTCRGVWVGNSQEAYDYRLHSYSPSIASQCLLMVSSVREVAGLRSSRVILYTSPSGRACHCKAPHQRSCHKSLITSSGFSVAFSTLHQAHLVSLLRAPPN